MLLVALIYIGLGFIANLYYRFSMEKEDREALNVAYSAFADMVCKRTSKSVGIILVSGIFILYLSLWIVLWLPIFVVNHFYNNNNSEEE